MAAISPQFHFPNKITFSSLQSSVSLFDVKQSDVVNNLLPSLQTLGQPVCSDRKGLTLLKLNFWCSMIFLVFSLHTLHSLLWLRLRDLNFTSPDPDLSWAVAGCCGWTLSWRGAMLSVSHQRSSPTIFSAKLSSTLKMSASDYFQAEWMQQQNKIEFILVHWLQ